ncbi:phospholipid scramblase [Fragilaria crotonensis]|nr:phospholipid scramblase [Fragilaria crotonensis]KAI2496770.1 phospholipid scramblase [Fragilaria crotonensis]
MGEKMDRGNDILKAHVCDTETMLIRQTRRGCEARTQFEVFVGGNQIADGLEDADCCCRLCCPQIRPFTMVVKEANIGAEMITIDRPFRSSFGTFKCCCYQEATVTSGGQQLGSMKEDCFAFVPSFQIKAPDGNPIYKVHPPTCCSGLCIDWYTEGNPCCGEGCLKVPFHVFPASQVDTDDDAPYIGKILRAPKSLEEEIFTNAGAFDLTFPKDATPQEKGLLMGSVIFINVNFFEIRG